MKKLQIIRTSFSRISLVDKFLLLFLFLFLAQIAYALFTKTESSELINSIDIIIRTFASAVFGYFLSGRFSDTLPRSNMIPAISQTTAQTATQADTSAPSSVRNKIGFSDLPSDKVLPGTTDLRTVSAPADHTFQTIIVSSVGLISLIILLILRNTSSVTDAIIAPLTQLRDMLSSSIGFLIGHKSQNNGSP